MLLLMLMTLDDERRALIEKIYQEDHDYLVKTAMSILKSYAAAEDAVSASYIKIITNINNILDKTRPQTRNFCVTIVKNTAIDMLRADKPLKFEPDIDDESVPVLKSTAFLTPEELVLRSEASEKIHDIMEQLPIEDRRLIHLHHLEGMGLKEVAKAMGLQLETTKKRHQRIISKLKKILHENHLDGSE